MYYARDGESRLRGRPMDDGNVYVCNDNDGVDDNSGETQLLNVGGIL